MKYIHDTRPKHAWIILSAFAGPAPRSGGAWTAGRRPCPPSVTAAAPGSATGPALGALHTPYCFTAQAVQAVLHCQARAH